MENKSGRLERYMNRNEARKKDMSSWDRVLSIGNAKWSVRDQKNMKLVSMFLKFASSVPCHFVDSPNFNVLVSRKALKARISSSKINFGSKCCQKCNPEHFRISKTSNPFLDFLDIFGFRSKMKILMTLHHFCQVLVIKSSPSPLYNLIG